MLELLPESWTVIAFLKIAGLVVGSASTVWALLQKTTYDDDGGRRRLTWAGKVAVALAASSFLVAGLSAGFDAVLAKAAAEEKRDSARKAQEEKERERRERSEREARELADKRQETNERRLNAAEVRASAAEQRIIILTGQEQQRMRDLALSQQLNVSTRENLARAEVSLAQLERVLQSLGPVTIRLRVRLDVSQSMPRLAEFGRQARRDNSILSATAGVLAWAGSETNLSEISFYDTSPLFPTRDQEPNVWAVANNLLTTLVFLAPGEATARWIPTIGGTGDDMGSIGDLRYELHRDPKALVDYDLDERTLSIWLIVRPNNQVERTGKIVSIPDLERSLAALQVRDVIMLGNRNVQADEVVRIRATAVPSELEIATSGRTYVLNADRFRKIARRGSLPAFVSAPIKSK